MELGCMKFAIGLILSLIVVVRGKVVGNLDFDGISASQQTIFRRSPNLFVQSQGYGGGSGDGLSGGMSSTSLQFNNGNNDPNSGLDVQSNAVGVGNEGGGGGGMSSTGLQFNNGSNNPDGGLSVQSNAVGGGNGNGGAGMSSTSLQFNNGGPCDGSNPNNNGLSVQSNAFGGGSGNGDGGMSSTGLQFSDGSDNPNGGLNVQSNAVGGGSGDGGGGMSSTGLQFNGGSSNPNSGLSVQSHAVGGGNGDGGVGMSSTSLQFNNGSPSDSPEPNKGGLNVQSNAVGLGGGDNNVGASQTTLQTTNDEPVVPDQNTDKNMPNVPLDATETTHTSLETNKKDDSVQVDNTSVGAINGEQDVGLSNTQVHEKEADQNFNVGKIPLFTSVEGGDVIDPSVQPQATDMKETEVDTTSTVNIDKNNTLCDTVVPSIQHDDNSVQVQTPGVVAAKSTNSVHIKDDEGDIDLNTLAAGSSDKGGAGASSVGVNMADGENMTQNNDQVKSTNTVIGNSDQGVGGSLSTVQVDDEKNERSLEAQTLGLGYSTDNSSGTLTADSMKYHDVDQDNHVVVNPDDGSIFQSSKQETNDISSQNTSSQYNTVDNDGTFSTTTHSITTETKQTQVVQQSYTEEQVINQQNQDCILNQPDQQIDQNQSTLLAEQSENHVQTQQVNQSENLFTSQQIQNNVVQSQDSTLKQQQTQTVQLSSTQQTQTTEQSQSSFLGSRRITVPHGHQASPMLCPDNNQGPGVVCHFEVASVFEYDNNYLLRPSQIVTQYCDVLIVSYAVLDVERFQIGAFSPDEERIFSEIVSLKNDDLKVILQLQYVAFYEQYIAILNSEDNLNRFTSSVINYLQKWNFDGIELPIMLPQSNEKFYETSPIVKEKFPILVEKLRSNFGNDQIISVCLPIEPDYIDFAYDISKILKHVNWFSVITLDYNVPDQGILQHVSPLTPQSSNDPFCIDFTVNYLLSDLHIPSDKLIINLPLYGSSFVLENYKNWSYGARVSGRGPKGPSSNVDGFLTISELCSVTKLNWLNSPAIVTDYDDVPTLVMKVTYARSKCLGGVGIHSISMDDPDGELCGQRPMPFTRAIALTYDPTRKVFGKDDNLQVVNYIDKSTTNKYEV